MKIEIRQKPLANGNKSLYLDIYDKGERRYQYLRLYLVPETDNNSKRINDNALKKAQEIRSKVLLGKKAKKKEEKQDKSITLMEWIEKYEQNMKDNRKVSDSTLAQTNMCKRIVESYLKSIHKPKLKLADFGRKELVGFLVYLKTKYVGVTGKSLSENAQVSYQQRIVAILNEAMRNELIKRNPMDLLSDQERIPKPSPTKKSLSIDEVKRIAKIKHPLHDEVRIAFLFSCFTGLRISDIYTLSWNNIIDTDKGKIIIKRQEKTESDVYIPLCGIALSLLPEKKENNNLVFHLPSRTSVINILKDIEEMAGIEHHFTYHNSRHTFGTLTMESIKDIETVSKLLGHKDIRNTVRYAGNSMDSKVHCVSMMDGLFG